jgi:chromosome segregation ATPase
MGLRSTLTQLLSAPTALVLEAALRDLVDEILDARDFVRKSELRSVEDRIETLRRELTERRSDLDAVRQAMTAWAGDLEDDLDDAFGVDDAALERLEEGRAALQRKLDLAASTLDVARDQLDGLGTQLTELDARIGQAHQVATSARATAEAAADGVSTLEAQS